MSVNRPAARLPERITAAEPDETIEWLSEPCSVEGTRSVWHIGSSSFLTWMKPFPEIGIVGYAEDWAQSVPSLVENLVAGFSERRQQEIRLNLLEILVNELKASVSHLQSRLPLIVPVNTFAPEPYQLLAPLLVSVQPAESGFVASWHDANIYSSGENEGDAVNSLKGLILDVFDTLNVESEAKLGREARRQLSVLKRFVKKES
jgi:hypothetical protein